MPATTFERALRNSPGSGQGSLDWFRDNVTRMRPTPERVIRENRDNMTMQPMNGKMYLFQYDPKTKKRMKYYDTFPLVLKLKRLPEGFLGINFHYLHYKQRAILMDALYEYASDEELNEESNIKVTYEILKGNARTRLFKPALKRYLRPQVESRFLEIMPEQWNAAIMLPIARFEKSDNRKVWRDSNNAI